MSVIAANPCTSKAPTIWTLITLDDFTRIEQPRDGDIAILVGSGVTQLWVFDSSFEGVPDGFEHISGGCHGAWNSGNSVVDVLSFGLSPDNTPEENDEALNLAMSLIPEGSTLRFSRGVFEISEPFIISKSLEIIADIGAQLVQTSTDTNGIRITASDVTIEGLRITGPQFALNPSNEYGIVFLGPSAASPISRVKVIGCWIDNWGTDGIHAEWVTDFEFNDNRIEDIYYAGIQMLSSLRGIITRNTIENIIGTVASNAYGVGLTRANNDSLVTHPRSADIIVSLNLIRYVSNWEGLDTHGGQRITFENNIIYGCRFGVAITRAVNGAGAETFAALDCSAIGNIIDSGVTDGSKSTGINLVGVSGGEQSTGIIKGNVIRGHGDVTSTVGAGIFTRDTLGAVISGNLIIEPSRYGICCEQNDENIGITDNDIIDPWSSASEAIGIRFRTTTGLCTGYVGGNRIGVAGKVSAIPLQYGIRVAAGNTITLGQNSSVGQTFDVAFVDQTLGPGMEFSGTMIFDSYQELVEIGADPPAPIANHVRFYCKDNGAGKTGLYARFNTGVVQQVALEP